MWGLSSACTIRMIFCVHCANGPNIVRKWSMHVKCAQLLLGQCCGWAYVSLSLLTLLSAVIDVQSMADLGSSKKLLRAWSRLPGGPSSGLAGLTSCPLATSHRGPDSCSEAFCWSRALSSRQGPARCRCGIRTVWKRGQFLGCSLMRPDSWDTGVTQKHC